MIATKTIPLMVPFVTDGMRASVQKVLQSRFIGQGPVVDEFERQFSMQIAGGRSCVAVGSCTDALHLAYLLAGIGPGDEIIAPLFTCTAGNESIGYGAAWQKFSLWTILKQMWRRRSLSWLAGPEVWFCDVAPDSLNMDFAHARSLLTPRTKAIVVVHYGGMPVDSRFFELGERLGIPVIEDCAQSLGSHESGSGDFCCFSFQAVKQVTTGDGGMLVLPRELTAKAKRMRWFGIDRAAKLSGTWENDITEVGYKYQMTDIAASMGLEGLKTLDWQVAYRRELRDAYRANLSGLDGIQVIDTDPRSACWLMTVLVERREDFRKKLIENGIESDQVHYRNDRYSIFKEFRVPGGFPNMDAIDGKYLCIPLHMGMDVGDVERICEVIRGGW